MKERDVPENGAHAEVLQRADQVRDETLERIAAARRKLAASDRKFRAYTRPPVST